MECEFEWEHEQQQLEQQQFGSPETSKPCEDYMAKAMYLKR